jgi:hypothetical protein
VPSGWSSAQGLAINTSGQVAGYIANNANGIISYQAFIGSMEVPLPSGLTNAEGVAVNDSGQVRLGRNQ